MKSLTIVTREKQEIAIIISFKKIPTPIESKININQNTCPNISIFPLLKTKKATVKGEIKIITANAGDII